MAFTNSPLVSYTKISPNKTVDRNHAIDTITIHCVVGQASVESLGSVFATTQRQASSNYGIGYDGRIGMYCEEKDRSWCSSNRANDHRAITIEVASDNYHPYAVTDAAYNALIELCADICRRNGIPKLLWEADKSLIGQVDKQNMTVHRWFENKACPGQYLYERHGDIANKVNAKLGAEESAPDPVPDPIPEEKPETDYGIPTKNGGQWRESVIRTILSNEKYVGDLLLQKTLITDHISKKQIRNSGQLPQYYIENAHEPVIDRETFALVQDEKKRRIKMYEHAAPIKAIHDFTSKIVCGQCGKYYRRKKVASGKVIWICSTYNRLGKAYCASQRIPDDTLRSLVGNMEFSEIRIPCANTITIVTPEGEEITKTWQNPSRSESWTPEMRERARQRSLTYGKEIDNCYPSN